MELNQSSFNPEGTVIFNDLQRITRLNEEQISTVCFTDLTLTSTMPLMITQYIKPEIHVDLSSFIINTRVEQGEVVINITRSLEPLAINSPSIFDLIGNNNLLQLRITKDKINKITHECVCLSFLQMFESDIKLSKRFDYKGDFERLSPDFVSEVNGILIAMDVSTSAYKPSIIPINSKIGKYEPALKDIIVKNKTNCHSSFVGVLSVSSDAMITNMRISEQTARSCILAKRIGDQIVMKCLEDKTIDASSLFDSQIMKLIDQDIIKTAAVCKEYNQLNKKLEWKEGMPDHLKIDIDVNHEFIERVRKMEFDAQFSKKVVDKFWLSSGVKMKKDMDIKSEDLITKELKDYDDRVREVIEKIGLSPNADKPISIFPIFTFSESIRCDMKETTVSSDVLMKYRTEFNDGLTVMERIWGKAVSERVFNGSNFRITYPTFHEPMEKTKEPIKGLNDKRNKFNRIKIDLDDDERITIALDGVQAKEFAEKEDERLKEKRQNSKKILTRDTDTSDISNFVDFGFWDIFFDNKPTESLWQKSRLMVNKLHSISHEIFGQVSFQDSENFVKMIELTKFGNYTYIIHRIVEELNFSMSQFTDKDQFILKQIDDLGVFLLIKSVSPDSHIFFSIMIDKRSFKNFNFPQTCFRKPAVENDDYMIFDFVSMNRHKISHMIGLTHKFIPYFAMWMELFEVTINDLDLLLFNDFEIDRKKDLDKMRNLQQTIAFNFCVYMEMSNKTSADLQQIRYAYMESVVATLVKPNPLKILVKFEDKIRSRFHIYILQRIIDSFGRMTVNRPQTIVQNANYEDQEREKIRLLNDDIKSDEFLEDQFSNTFSDEQELENIVEDIRKKNINTDLLEDYSVFSKKNASVLRFSRLLNFINNKEIPTFDIALNLSYFSHVHNKNDMEQNQAEMQIFRKVLEQELLLALRKVFKEFSNDVDLEYENHEFSVQFAVNCGTAASRYLERKLGSNYQKIIQRNFVVELSRKTNESLATLKSSAVRATEDQITIYEDYEKLKEHLKETQGKRRRVLEGILETMKNLLDTNLPFVNISNLMLKLINLGGTYAILFKKNQIGNAREIFILDIISRLTIHFQETLARVVCEEIENEMLTKGDLKLMRSTEHFDKISFAIKDKFKDVITGIDSGDCSTWAQRFIMRVFSAVWRGILPENLWEIMNTLLSLHTHKMLELPVFLLYKFIQSSTTQSMDKGMNELKKQFLFKNDPPVRLVEQHSRLLRNLSNMEQGIMHYESSGIHACFKLHMSELNHVIVKSIFAGYLDAKYYKFKRTDKVSSDDFSTIRSIIFIFNEMDDLYLDNLFFKIVKETFTESIPDYLYKYKKDEKLQYVRRYLKKRAAVLITHLSYFEERCMKLLTIKQSREKSTIGSLNYVEEFNSIWILSNTILSPKIKFFYSATQMTPLSNMYNRINTMFDTRKSLTESGSGLLPCAIVQECQSMLHYETLGLTSIKEFDEYKDLLFEKPSVSYGLYLKEPDCISGIFGFDFVHYKACDKVSRYSQCEFQNFSKDALEFNENGLSSIKTFLLLGQGQKYKKFLKRLTATYPEYQNWRDYIEENPVMLFRPSVDKKEGAIKILKKAFTPSSSDAFSFLSQNKVFSSSVYILTFPSVTRTINQNTSEVKILKQSLIGILRDIVLTNELKNDDKTIMFPSRDFYDDLGNIIDEKNNLKFQKKKPKGSNKYILMNVPKVTSLAPATLLDVCKYKWFTNLEIRKSKTELDYSWIIYQRHFPWLRETIQQTLSEENNPPLKSVSSLYDFISSMNPKSRSFKVLTKGKKKNDLKSTIMSIVKTSYDLSGRLVEFSLDDADDDTKDVDDDNDDILINSIKKTKLRSKRIENKEDIDQFMSLKNDIALINESPILNSDKAIMINDILLNKSKKMKILQKIFLSNKMFNVSHSLRILLLFLCYAQWNDILDRINNNKNDLTQDEIDCVYVDSNRQIERKFSDLMLFIKGGVFGYFTAKQKYNIKESKYKGKGTMKFIFDDLITEIELIDEFVTRINCSDKELFRQKKNLVSNLLKQMEVTTMTDLYRYNQILIQEKLNPIFWFDGKDVKSSKTPNPDHVAVYLDSTLRIEAVDFPFQDLGFSLDDKTMRLILKIRRGEIQSRISYIYPTIASFTAKATKNESSRITMSNEEVSNMIKNIFSDDNNIDVNFVENISAFYDSYLNNKEASAKNVLETSNSISHFYSNALRDFESFKTKFNIMNEEDVYKKLNPDAREEYKQKDKLVNDLMNMRTDIREALLSRLEFFLNHRQRPLDIMGINDATYRMILSQQKKKGNLVFDYLERLSSSSYSEISTKEVTVDQIDPDIIAAFKSKMDNLEEVGLTRKNPFEGMFDSDDEEEDDFDQIENLVPRIGEDVLEAVLGSIGEIDENIIQKQDYLTMLSKETKRPYSYFVKTFDNLIIFLQGEQKRPLIIMLINHLIWSRELLTKDIIDFVVNKTYANLKDELIEKRRKLFYLLSVLFLNDLKDKPLTQNSFLGIKIEELKNEKKEADLADKLLEDF